MSVKGVHDEFPRWTNCSRWYLVGLAVQGTLSLGAPHRARTQTQFDVSFPGWTGNCLQLYQTTPVAVPDDQLIPKASRMTAEEPASATSCVDRDDDRSFA